MARLNRNYQERRPLDATMFSEQEWEEIARILTLTRRELQIIHGIFDDRTETAIAIHLGVSAHTVHTHFNRLYRKLAVHTRTGLILRVVDESSVLKRMPVPA